MYKPDYSTDILNTSLLIYSISKQTGSVMLTKQCLQVLYRCLDCFIRSIKYCFSWGQISLQSNISRLLTAKVVGLAMFLLCLCLSRSSLVYGGCINDSKTDDVRSEKNKVEIHCGSHRVAIICGRKYAKESRRCDDNKLVFVSVDGTVYEAMQSKKFKELFVVNMTPIALNCARGNDGKYYVMVEYSIFPWYYAQSSVWDLFSEGGKRLTVNGGKMMYYYKKKGLRFNANNAIYIEGAGK